MPSKLPHLSLLTSLGSCDQLYNFPPEREIDRKILLDVAPDREALLMGNKTIEEIRQTLKLRIKSPNGHWLYRTQMRREVKLKELTTRLSAFGRFGPDVANENIDNEGNTSFHVIRRVLSASSVPQPCISPMTSIANTLNPIRPLTDIVDLGIWTGAPLSTEDKLISPRPLGATHILVVYAMDPSDTTSPVDGCQRTVRRCKGNGSLTYPEVAEVPINDLLFILNLPNLSRDSDQPILPRRLPKQLPKVLMRVPNLQTFPELVIYLHTKNQAELFRRLIPEWMRDLMHPLPPIPSPPVPPVPPVPSTPSVGNVATCALVASFDPRRLLVRLIPASSSLETTTSTASSVPTFVEPERSRSISSIAAEISQTALEFAYKEAVVHTATLLDALHDNLCHIGYLGKDLWHELDLSRDILRRAISQQAKIPNDSKMQ